jgi:isocitrate dehydrogenase (NAD+)
MTGTKRRVVLIRGDGIGPEVADAVVSVLEAARAPLEFEEAVVGRRAEETEGDPLPPGVVELIRRRGVALKGPVGTPIGKGFASVNVRLRKTLDLYANLRPVKTVPAVPARYEDVDIVVIRENTEDLYSGLEHIVVPGVVESLKIITEVASTRIAEFAFEYARRHGRRRVTAIHKANIMKLSDGLFLDCFRRVAAKYPDVEADDRIVDAACMRLVMDPHGFDVMLLENLYGDIVSDIAAGLVGGLGVVPGANIGDGVAVFEAVHGSAPDIAGRGVANPTALVLSAALMLEHLGERAAADHVRAAVETVLRRGGVRTGDLGGRSSTAEYTAALCGELRSRP